MSEKKSLRLNKLAKEFNVGMDRILLFLEKKGIKGIKPSSKIPNDVYMDLLGEFQPDLKAKLAADLASKEREDKKREQEKKDEEQSILINNQIKDKERVISNNELKERPNEFDYGRSQVSNKSKLSLKIRL